MNQPLPAVLRSLLCSLLMVTSSSSLLAQQDNAPPWIAMDYGPYMTHSFQAAEPAGNIAYKGLWIRLGKEGQSVLFDTDLLRYAGAWLESDLDWRNVIFDGSHGTHPRVLGDQLMGNPLQPGWAHQTSFKDPRPRPHGPLDHDHARFRGLYLHGRQVILSYTVGPTGILELAGLADNDSATAVTRTLEIDAHDQPLLLNVSTRPVGLEASSRRTKNGTLLLFAEPAAEKQTTEGKQDQLKQQLRQKLLAHWTFDAEAAGPIHNQLGTLFSGVSSTTARQQGVRGQALLLAGKDRVTISQHEQMKMGLDDFTITAWVRTSKGGTIFARGPAKGIWEPQGKTMFVRGGKLCFDVGWVGAIVSRRTVADGKWHHVAVSCRADGLTQLYVDGQADNAKALKSPGAEQHVIKIGHTADNFVPPLTGALDDVTFHQRVLTPAEVAHLAGGVKRVGESRAVAWTGSAKATLIDHETQLQLKIAPASKTSQLTLLFWKGEAAAIDAVASLADQQPGNLSLAKLTQGGPARYADKTITTTARQGEEKGPYAIDELTLPRDNPWRAWMRLGGFDFFKDGRRAAVCTWNGDLWIVEGLATELGQLHWRRVATGMFQPLGVKIVDETIYVGCRDQITRLHDLNGDGEMDFYQTFNNDHQVTEHFHEFAMDLQTDSKGNFYYAKSARHALDSVVPHHGTLIRVSPDGRTSEIVCNGFRAANGVGIGPRGELATSDQEGHWTPANRINICRPGGFYGNMYSFHVGERPEAYDPPLVWLPKNVDRSPAAQLWVDSDRWGPFQDHMISTSYGTGKLWHVMYEEVEGVIQGGVTAFPIQFPTGIMRGRFRPDDGQLYLSGMVGWSSSTGVDGGFFRLRRTSQPVLMATSMRVVSDGIEVTFSDPLSPDAATDIDNYAVEQWNYRWSANYGSPHFKVSNPRTRGQDEVEVYDVVLRPDGKTVFLEIEDLKPVMQMQISFNIRSAADQTIKGDIWLTINKVPGGK
jgi:hypothetical protein